MDRETAVKQAERLEGRGHDCDYATKRTPPVDHEGWYVAIYRDRKIVRRLTGVEQVERFLAAPRRAGSKGSRAFDPALARPRGAGSLAGHYWREYAITPESDPGAGEYELLISECLSYVICSCRGHRTHGHCRHADAAEAIERLRMERHYAALSDRALYAADRAALGRALAGFATRAEVVAYLAIGEAVGRRMNEVEAA